jgi:hypothetical protein
MYPSPNPLPYFVRKGAILLFINAFPLLAKQGGGSRGWVCVFEEEDQGLRFSIYIKELHPFSCFPQAHK